MKPLTNETLIERFEKEFRCKSIACPKPCPSLKSDEMEPIKKFLKSAIQAKEDEMKEKIKSKKKYWHIRFEGISDPVISAERKKFNEEVSELINSVLDDLLSNLSK